jgi:hypothetical protein
VEWLKVYTAKKKKKMVGKRKEEQKEGLRFLIEEAWSCGH